MGSRRLVRSRNAKLAEYKVLAGSLPFVILYRSVHNDNVDVSGWPGSLNWGRKLIAIKAELYAARYVGYSKWSIWQIYEDLVPDLRGTPFEAPVKTALKKAAAKAVEEMFKPSADLPRPGSTSS